MSACELEGGRRRAAGRLDPRAALSPPPRRDPAPPRPFFPTLPGKDPCLSVFSGFPGWGPHASVPSFRVGPSSILFPPSLGPSRWDSSFDFFQGPRAAGLDPSAPSLPSLLSRSTPGGSPAPSSVLFPQVPHTISPYVPVCEHDWHRCVSSRVSGGRVTCVSPAPEPVCKLSFCRQLQPTEYVTVF